MTTVAEGVDDALAHLGLDSQTSGGLLIAVPADRHAELLEALSARAVQGVTVGRFTEESDGRIELVESSQKEIRMSKPADKPQADATGQQGQQPSACCAGGADAASGDGAAG